MDLNKINNLIIDITDVNKFSMVSKPLFQTVIRNYYNINSLEGDIIEVYEIKDKKRKLILQ